METGPCGLCGARATRCASARAAMRRACVSPPQCVMSGCRTLAPPTASSSLNACRLVSRSPVAMGVDTARWIAARSFGSSGQHGSSSQYRPNGSSACAKRWPMRGEGRAWQSTMMSMSSPTASRIARHAALGLAQRRQALDRHRRRHRHRLERGEAGLDHRPRALGEVRARRPARRSRPSRPPRGGRRGARGRAPARPRAGGRARRAPCRGCPRARGRCRRSRSRARCPCRARSARGA